MEPNLEDREIIRLYLLGTLSDASQRRQVEERLLTEDDYFVELEIIEDELIDQYLCGSLAESEREGFEKQFMSTSERQQKLRFARVLRRYVAAAEAERPVVEKNRNRAARWLRQFFRQPLGRAACALLLLGVGLIAWRLFFSDSDLRKGLVALNSAYRVERPTEARISSFDYAPFANMRGSSRDKVDHRSLDHAARLLLDAAHQRPTPATHHALGQLYLARGELDKALAEFQAALAAGRDDAQLESDFGAALLERGRRNLTDDKSGRGVEELAKSLEHIGKALELNASLPAALFNRALWFKYMLLPHQAADAWRKYLEVDAGSPWAAEAQRNLKELEERKSNTAQSSDHLLDDFLAAYAGGDEATAWKLISQNREALSTRPVWQQLIDSCLSLSSDGDAKGAGQRLDALSYAAELELRKAADPYLSGLSRFYRSLSQSQLRAQEKARSLMKAGHKYYAESRYDEAINAYAGAEEAFKRAGDWWEARLVRYCMVPCYLESTRTARALSLLEELVEACKQEDFKWLLMRAFYSLSIARADLNEYSKAIDYMNRSLELAAQIDDTAGEFNALDVLTGIYNYIGNTQESLACVQRSLPLTAAFTFNPLSMWRHQAIVASAFSYSGLYAAALEYQREALRLALAAGETSMKSVSFAHLGLIYGKLRQYDEAIRNMQAAYEAAKEQEGQLIGKKMMGYSALQLAHLRTQMGDLERAVEGYDRSIRLFNELEFSPHLYEAHKGRLFCYIQRGEDSLARDELQTTLALIEKYRSAILEESNKDAFSDVEQTVYDLAMDFQYSRLNDPKRAFEYSEASRARTLLDIINTGADVVSGSRVLDIAVRATSQPFSLESIQQRLPEGAQILQYAVLDKKLLIWTISRTGFAAKEREIAQGDLNELVLSFVRSVSGGEGMERAVIERQSRELYKLLIEPVADSIDPRKQLCIIPDKTLNYLPFAALISPSSGKYLIEEYALEYSPSTTVFIICSEEAGRKEKVEREKILSVGNPLFDRADFPSLPDLPSAEREAREIAGYYASSLLLVNREATKRRLQEELSKSDVIHLASHFIVDEQQPMLSRLVLAKPPEKRAGAAREREGVLEVNEVYGVKLLRPRLVILSACQTGVGRYFKGEGLLSMARPFIAAGVPLTLSSLWPVESDATAELMIAFHRYRKQEGRSTVEALRKAQIEMIRRPDERLNQPFSWASFLAVGGYANY